MYHWFVLMSLKEMSSVWGMNPNGVLHVGAHLGEEANEYESYGNDTGEYGRSHFSPG